MEQSQCRAGIDSVFIRATTSSKDVEVFESEQLVPEKDSSYNVTKVAENSFAARLNQLESDHNSYSSSLPAE